MIIEYIVVGFFTAFGWWGANHFVIDKYLEPKPPNTAPNQQNSKS
jgi:hypothetical protein